MCTTFCSDCWKTPVKTEIILASASPRRVALLRNICPTFKAVPSGADESLPPGIDPREAVQLLAQRKASFLVKDYPQALVIGADTVVAMDGELLGKPVDAHDAARMLRLLSGRVHTVYTGVSLCAPTGNACFCVGTDVTFYPLSEEDIRWYIATGEPFDKAGAYGIQEKGALLVERIEGDYFNVMGFPVARVARQMGALLEKASIS